jgi:hypothetical protein
MLDIYNTLTLIVCIYFFKQRPSFLNTPAKHLEYKCFIKQLAWFLKSAHTESNEASIGDTSHNFRLNFCALVSSD